MKITLIVIVFIVGIVTRAYLKHIVNDNEKLKPEEIITTYKNQQSCERGFRFLKDPLFFADSFFVENPERIETMLFLMSLCLGMWIK